LKPSLSAAAHFALGVWRMSGSIKSSLAHRILNAGGASGGQKRRRRMYAHTLVESLETRQMLSAVATSMKFATTQQFGQKAPTPTKTTSAAPVAIAPLSETFNLSSRPGATKTIYLDYNGQTTTGTPRNQQITGGADITTPAFSLDVDTANFSTAELIQIQRMWQRVVEDFSPFDVNVTTKDPPLSDIIDSGGGDNRWGIRVVIGGDFNDWFKIPAGGVAFLNSFGSSTDIPCYAWSVTQGLDEQVIAETISHETGHTLGLNHDGTSQLGYYSGHGFGPTSWGPIMGAPFGISVTQWSKGEYPGANNKEDDLQIITTQNGFGYRNDDYGNNRFTASQLPTKKVGATRTVNISGVIEKNTDQDWFTFTTTGGTVNLSFDGDSISSDLDISVSLFDSSGTLLQVVNPAQSLSANLFANLPAGTYSLMIDGVGFGSLSTGYSDYGSLGQYFITGTYPDTSSGTGSGGTSVIQGRVVSDANNNKLIDGADAGISGVVVFIDLDANGVFNATVDRSARTDASGNFQFTGLLGGNYNIYQITPAGWQQATPGLGGLNVFVAANSTTSNQFFRNVRPPVISSIGASGTFKIGSTPLLLASAGKVADVDTPNFAGGTLTVGITANAGSTDLITVRNVGNGPGQVGAFAGFVRYSGVTVGTMSGGLGGSDLVIRFNSNASLAIVQAILRNLVFSTTLTPGARTLAFSLSDGHGGFSSTLTKQVSVT
jgi:hypothetical protein